MKETTYCHHTLLPVVKIQILVISYVNVIRFFLRQNRLFPIKFTSTITKKNRKVLIWWKKPSFHLIDHSTSFAPPLYKWTEPSSSARKRRVSSSLIQYHHAKGQIIDNSNYMIISKAKRYKKNHEEDCTTVIIFKFSFTRCMYISKPTNQTYDYI